MRRAQRPQVLPIVVIIVVSHEGRNFGIKNRVMQVSIFDRQRPSEWRWSAIHPLVSGSGIGPRSCEKKVGACMEEFPDSIQWRRILV